MSDGISKWHDDLDEWAELCRTAGITDVNWDVYSKEAQHAREGYRKKKLRGGELKFYVKQALERDELDRKQQEEADEYQLYLRLKKKYDK